MLNWLEKEHILSIVSTDKFPVKGNSFAFPIKLWEKFCHMNKMSFLTFMLSSLHKNSRLNRIVHKGIIVLSESVFIIIRLPFTAK